MADKVVITDPYVFDKSLKDKSLEQLENEVKFRLAVIEERKREQERKEIEALVLEVNAAHETVSKGLMFLFKQNALHEAIVAAYTTAGGSFAPHFKHNAIDADKLIALKAVAVAAAEGKSKKTRGSRKASA